jgi:hypothetical protein
MVYIAGPYSRIDPVENTHRTIKVADELLASGLVTPVVPHPLTMTWHLVSPKEYQTWLDYDLEVLARCDAVLRLPGESTGADGEERFAAGRGIPVFHNAQRLLAWAKTVRPPLIIVGLGHRARTGKDAIAAHLANAYCFKRVAFADSLKAVVGDLAPYLRPDIADRIADLGVDRAKNGDYGDPTRDLLVVLGNAMRRHVNPDTWVRAVTENLVADWPYVVTDVRYPNEVEALRRLGATLVRVDRPDVPLRDDIADNALASFDGWDQVLVNDGTLQQLQAKANELVASLVWSGPALAA